MNEETNKAITAIADAIDNLACEVRSADPFSGLNNIAESLLKAKNADESNNRN